MDQQIITAYGICSSPNYEEMAGFVNEKINHGWQPYNQPFTSIYNNNQFFHQAMVKYQPVYIIVNGDEEIITTKDNVDAVLNEITRKQQKTAAAKKKTGRRKVNV